MKALTICQPYAHLIVRGEKRVENREWYTRYRGPLLIHAGKSRDWMSDHDEQEFNAMGDPMSFGALIGISSIVDCLNIEHIRRGDHDARYPWLRTHDHTNGTWCLVLGDVRRMPPLQWKGAQGLWNVQDAMLQDWIAEANRITLQERSHI